METFDPDDRQRHEIAAMREGYFLGRQFYRKITGALMESLSYDLPMRTHREPEPAWRSLVEPERFPAEILLSEVYERENGLGAHWRPPQETPVRPGVRVGQPAWAKGNRTVLAAVAIVALFQILTGERKSA